MPASNNRNRRKRRPTPARQPMPMAEMAVAPPPDATADRYAPTAWKGGNKELTLPSGQLCLVRKLTPEDLIEMDLLDRFDSLTGMVQKQHIAKKSHAGGPPRRQATDHDVNLEVAKLMKDPAKFTEMYKTVDRIVMAMVVAPVLQPKPEDEADRDPNGAYIDWVDDEDKGFLLEYAFGGVNGLEQFRREVRQSRDGVDHVEDVALPAE